jgi:hypothetical protein
MKRKITVKVDVAIGLRRRGTTADDRWTGHVVLNGDAICGEPIPDPRKLSWEAFTAKPCKKCRDLLVRGSFGSK